MRWLHQIKGEDMNEEPVAWRWRWKDLPDAGWQLSSVCGWRDTEHIDAQPLYLHPPHQPKRTVTYVCPVCAASLERQE